MARSVGRLTQRREFLRVAAARRKWAAPGLVLQVRRTPKEQDPSTSALRVGFTATKKIGNAVVRNRARRRLRAAVNQIMPVHAAPAHDYVVIARAGTVRRRYADLVNDLETALKKLGAFEPASDTLDDDLGDQHLSHGH